MLLTYEPLNEKDIICYTEQGESFLINLEDLTLIEKYDWVKRKDGYFITLYKNDHKQHLMHRLIMNPPKGKQIDHINHNRSDNRKENLRICDPVYNSYNKSPTIDKSVPIVGVYNCYKECKKHPWCASLEIKGKNVCKPKRFTTLEEAIIARLQAEAKYYGEYAPNKNLFKQYGITIEK